MMQIVDKKPITKLFQLFKISPLFVVSCFVLIISRYWGIFTIPSYQEKMGLIRVFSATSSILIGLLIVFNVAFFVRNKKILSWILLIYAICPSLFAEARYANYQMIYIAGLLACIAIILLSSFKSIRFICLVGMIAMLGLIYQESIYFPQKPLVSLVHDLINNVMHLGSFSYLFFANTSFWFGGFRESGVFSITMLPFLLVGLYIIIQNNKYRIYLLLIACSILLTANAKLFPENASYTIYVLLLIPVIGRGASFLTHWYSLKIKEQKNILVKSMFVFIGISFYSVIVYDHIRLLHEYKVHYAQRVSYEYEKITKPF